MVHPHGSVLLVDDDYDVLLGVSDVLTDEGYHVTTAAHGAEAVELLRGGLRPDLILLDLMMPVMDGETFCGIWRADPTLATIPVFILSADGAAERKTAACGANGLLRKPPQLADLLAVVGRYAG